MYQPRWQQEKCPIIINLINQYWVLFQYGVATAKVQITSSFSTEILIQFPLLFVIIHSLSKIKSCSINDVISDVNFVSKIYICIEICVQLSVLLLTICKKQRHIKMTLYMTLYMTSTSF